MSNFNPNIPTVSIEQADPVTGLVSFGTVRGTPPAGAGYAGIFSLECLLQDLDGSGTYQNTGSVAVPAWSLIGAGAAGSTGPTGYTGPAGTGATGPTGYTGPNIGSGINFGPSAVTSITVVNGIITAIS
jgi:hypothetical protein